MSDRRRDGERDRYSRDRQRREDTGSRRDSPVEDRHRQRERSRERDRRRSRSKDRDNGRRKSPAGHSTHNVPVAAEEQQKKTQRLAKLAAWRNKRGSSASEANGEERAGAEVPQQEKAWMPWEDPTAAFTSAEPEPQPPPRLTPLELPTFTADDGVDPLDAFMASEINPEVRAKEAEEAKKREEELKERAKQRAEGKIPKLEKLLEESSDEEEQPDAEVQVPEHKVKLVVGQGGEKIKLIQRKSKCRLQIKKSEDELKKGFLEKRSYALPKARKVGDEVKMVTIMLFGNAKECDIATRMIDEAVENREQKQKQREREYERKRDAKSRDRQMYHLRHTRDYETLEIPIGASKADAKKAFRELAKKWHPDKHPTNAEEAKLRFQAIQSAYESLMSTDEDAKIEALAHR